MTEPTRQTPETMMRDLLDVMARACDDIAREAKKESPSWEQIVVHFNFLYTLKGRGEVIHNEIMKSRGIFRQRRRDERVDHGI